MSKLRINVLKRKLIYFISDVKIDFFALSANRANHINPVTDQRVPNKAAKKIKQQGIL